MFSSALVSLFVCLFVRLYLFVCLLSAGLRKPAINQFSQNSVERRHVDHGRND